jgi:uncharacterized integral membrane protein
MKRSTLLVLVPVALIATMLALANRETVVFRLDPFAAGEPAFSLAMPLFLLVFLSFLLGVLVGGATVFLRRGRSARKKQLSADDMARALALDADERRPGPSGT